MHNSNACSWNCGGTFTNGNTFGLTAPLHSGFEKHNFYNMPKKQHSYEYIEEETKARAGSFFQRFELREGDCFPSSDGGWNDCETDRERFEFSSRPRQKPEGKQCYGYSLMLDKNFKTVHPTNTDLGQVHQRGGPKGTAGGFKEVIFEVSGEEVYGTMKYESGVHRVQRVPQTETQGRVHTSAATVMVLPEAEEFDVEINMNDVRVDYFCSSGPGGQSVNTTYSAVRLTHEPTGIVAQCQDQKSQHKNKEKALKVLRSRLYELELNKKLEQDAEKRNSLVSSGDRSAKIRTYNYPQGRVTDHRIALTLYDLQNIINGDIQKLVDELKLYQNTQKLKEAGETL